MKGDEYVSEKLRRMAKNIKPKVTNEIVDDTLVITLSGSVGEPFWYDDEEEDFINAKRVESLVNGSDKDIVIKLNSPGGDVFDGIEVYNYLKSLDNHITIEVTALAASAASIIAMAGDEIVMDTGSQMMIHQASTITWGNKAEHYKTINALETIDSSIVSIYAERTDIDRDTLSDWLSGETWFTAEEAVAKGMADVIGGSQKVENTVNISIDTDDVVQKVIAHLESKNKLEEKPKTGLSKIFGGKK